MEYKTMQGDTWDIIAKKVYDDETQIGMLQQNNPKYIDVWIFDAGCMISVPELDTEENEDIPDWREDSEDVYGEDEDE